MILDSRGGLIWFKPLASRIFATDFRVQTLNGKPVLTWWQGYFGGDFGSGEDLIYDTSYHQIGAVKRATASTPICTSSSSPRRERL